MKVKETTRYMLREYRRPTIIYYGICALIVILSLILHYIVKLEDGIINGMDTASMIFLFVMGLNSFKSQFMLFVQNGVSRRTMLMGFLLAATCLSCVLAVIDSLYPLLLGNSLHYFSLYKSMYQPATGVGAYLGSLIWSALLYMVAICAGFFLTTLYYRMNKAYKILVSVGVPALVFVVMPILDVYIPSLNFYGRLLRAFTWMLGLDPFSAAYPLRAMASFLVISAVFTGLSFLLIRRATVKEA